MEIAEIQLLAPACLQPRPRAELAPKLCAETGSTQALRSPGPSVPDRRQGAVVGSHAGVTWGGGQVPASASPLIAGIC